MSKPTTNRRAAWQGMNWCRPATRLAIYLRDGMACVWCGAGAEDAARLTLDHLRPHTHGGTNVPTNLVTACVTCNSARGAQSVSAFAARRAAGPAETMALITAVRNKARRKLPRAQARALLKTRTTNPTSEDVS